MSDDIRKQDYAFLPVLDRHERGGTVQRIQDVIRDAIVRLEMRPGEAIDKNALCERLNVSRFPVSEALGRLAEEGFVVVLPQRGTMVSRIDLAACRQAMFIRRALECEAVRYVAPGISDDLIQKFRKLLAGQQRAMAGNDRNTFHALDLAFHALLLETLGYDRVTAAVDAARANLDRMRLFLCTPVRQHETFAEHEQIFAALSARQPEESAKAMSNHLDEVMSELEDFAKAHPELVTPGQTAN
ncbi:GntR family transcriptional regulator [Undibacter mobilis]|uniref:GntR family transcriptional regulator n=1 Tax=Undibacter mobilis TaxID=2292256 RepID=A0A371B3P2_9BRAD|nr:GntR family transcriptional regulator [Undibacter mobilis]RDV02117.1 GntR family transcriptional regulator [Undibacter mobilis]